MNPINIREATKKMEVDHRIPLQYYYKIADNLLKEHNFWRDMHAPLVLCKNSSAGEQYHRSLHSASQIRRSCIRNYTFPPRLQYYKSYKKKLLDVLRELECLRPEVEREINKANRVHALKEQIRLNAASSSRQTPRSRMASLWPDNKQTRHSRLTLNIPRPVTPEVVVPSAPPIENLVIDDDAPLHSGSAESSFVDSSSSTTENLSKRHDEGSSNAASSCIICYEAPIEGACVPCGHMAGCMSCLNEIKTKSWGCPVCRTKIELVLRLYAV